MVKPERKNLKALKRLSDSILIFLDALDSEMKKPESHERGKRVAQLCNWLDIENDRIRYSELGVNYRRDDKRRAVEKIKAHSSRGQDSGLSTRGAAFDSPVRYQGR